ncbi:MAG: folate hydrolase [Gemmatimonadaceae bacterium]|nr:folate hydrolase [Gemmatimonadaceae bacterium]
MTRLFHQVAVLMATIAMAVPLAAQPLLGFDEDGTTAQRDLETAYDEALSADDLRTWMRYLSARPHHVGSAYGKQNAEYLAELFTSWGYDTDLERYDILLPVPEHRQLELLEPYPFTATLDERTLAEDASTAVRDDLLPPYNAYSVDGDVTAELVFVNYGTPEDYELLARYGVSVEGRIVIVKYGRTFRGIKPKVAAEHGAIGTIIYSDPANDGYARGDVYPKGGFKNDSGVQRGSVMDITRYAGDPLTPFEPSKKGVERLSREDVDVLAPIPTLPISYADALPLLESLDGPVAPGAWRGALPITYHIGPGPAKVHLKVKFDWRTVAAYNVIARMQGSTYPDEWILRGNHHDAWNHGAQDPISGLITVLAEAQAIGQLAREGQPPKRTLIFAAWDAEEEGLIGSSEWAEDHREELDEKGVAYINTDTNGRGFLGLGGSPTLEVLYNGIMRDVIDPETGLTVGARQRARMLATGNDKTRKEAARSNLRLHPLGSGSDYTPFLQHLGLASSNSGFGGEGGGGSYHTLYDTYEHFTRFHDPEFAYGVTLAQVNGRALLRLANAEVLPFEFRAFSGDMARAVEGLETLADKMRTETERVNGLIEDGRFAAALDPTQPLQPPSRKAEVPHFNFAPLQNALGQLDESAEAFETARTAASPPADALQQLNKLLYTSERLLTREHGLPGRPWYRHHIYAPGFYTGYGAKTFPGVREAIEQRRFDEVEEQIVIVAGILESFAARLDEAAALLPSPEAGD